MEKKFSNNIKNMKPKKNSKYHQGMLDPKSLVKYFTSCKNEPIIYRSGLEYQFIMFCESNPKIKKWASEPISIKYFSRLANNDSQWLKEAWIKNTDKWNAATEFAHKHNAKFIIVTEKFFQ